MAHQVFDDMFPTSLVHDIEGVFTNFELDWHYIKYSSGQEANYTVDPYSKDCPQMVHILYSDGWVSPYSEIIRTMLYFVQDKTETPIRSLHRIKANLTIPDGTSDKHFNTPHVDHEEKNFLSMVYYVNDADGDTIIFDKFKEHNNEKMNIVDRIQPSRGRCVIFPSTQMHSSTNPINFQNRIILNFVFEV